MKPLPINPILLSRLAMLGLLLAGTFSYLWLEDSTLLRLSVVCLSLVAGVFLLLRRRVAFPAMLTLFLLSVALNSWYFGASGPLVISLLGFVVAAGILTRLLFFNEGIRLPFSTLLLFGLLGAEVFLMYAFFLVGPTSIGILLLCYFYLLWGVILVGTTEGEPARSIFTYLGLSSLLTILTLYSAQLAR